MQHSILRTRQRLTAGLMLCALLLAGTARTALAQSSAQGQASAQPGAVKGEAPQPAGKAFYGIALVYVKNWDRLREYEQRLGPLMQPYNVTMVNQILPDRVSETFLNKPDRIDVFYFKDPKDMDGLFSDPAVRREMAWRDEHATEKVIFLGGAPLFPLEN